jgi:hypothetical protein
MTTKRRSHRTQCPQCGRRVTVRDNEVLMSHLVRKPSDSEQGWNVPRCPGGFIPPSIGDVVEVKLEPVNPTQPPVEESGHSIRAIQSGLPGHGRRR